MRYSVLVVMHMKYGLAPIRTLHRPPFMTAGTRYMRFEQQPSGFISAIKLLGSTAILMPSANEQTSQLYIADEVDMFLLFGDQDPSDHTLDAKINCALYDNTEELAEAAKDTWSTFLQDREQLEIIKATTELEQTSVTDKDGIPHFKGFVAHNPEITAIEGITHYLQSIQKPTPGTGAYL